MGLTIHYTLQSDTRSVPKARKLIEQLRQRALDLPFQTVSDLVELGETECDFTTCERDAPNRWLLIQAGRYVEHDNIHYTVIPKHVIAFSAIPGELAFSGAYGGMQLLGWEDTQVSRKW